MASEAKPEPHAVRRSLWSPIQPPAIHPTHPKQINELRITLNYPLFGPYLGVGGVWLGAVLVSSNSETTRILDVKKQLERSEKVARQRQRLLCGDRDADDLEVVKDPSV